MDICKRSNMWTCGREGVPQGPENDAYLQALAVKWQLPEELAVIDEDPLLDELGDRYNHFRDMVADSNVLWEENSTFGEGENPIGHLQVISLRGHRVLLYLGDWGQAYFAIWAAPTLLQQLIREA